MDMIAEALKIKTAREEAGLTQEELAKMVGVHRLTVLKWENGQTEPSPMAKNMLRILLNLEI